MPVISSRRLPYEKPFHDDKLPKISRCPRIDLDNYLGQDDWDRQSNWRCNLIKNVPTLVLCPPAPAANSIKTALEILTFQQLVGRLWFQNELPWNQKRSQRQVINSSAIGMNYKQLLFLSGKLFPSKTDFGLYLSGRRS